MPDHRILILDTSKLTAYAWHKGQVRVDAEFTPEETGFDGFRSYLKKNLASLFHLLVDLPDESFQQDTLPHVVGSDRRALLARKLTQNFFGTPYTLAISLGREKEGRKDERFLFTALTRPQSIDPWVAIISEVGAPLAGIYSPAQTLPTLVGKEAASNPHLVLMTLTQGGLRQSHYVAGQLRFSRLTQLATGSIEEAAISTVEEATKIHQYLVAQRLVTRGQKIPVLFLATQSDITYLEQACQDTEDTDFRFMDINDACKASHFKSVLVDSHIDPLMAHLLVQKIPADQYAPSALRKDYRRWQARLAIKALSLLLLAVSLLYAARSGVEIYSNSNKAEESSLARAAAQARYDGLVRSLPVVAVNPDHLRALIERWQELKQNSPDFERSLEPLSHALQLNSMVELSNLDWRISKSPDDARAIITQPMPAGQSNTGNYLVMDIEAQLPSSLRGDRRAQSEIIDQFAESMKRDPQDNIRILQKPFETDSGKALKTGSDSRNATTALNFTVRYWRKLTP